jgi:hypothetical protein
MPLSENYLQKFSAVPAYFDAMLGAKPPERFSVKFLENLGFTSTNDRLLIGVLKDLGLLNRDGVPQHRYYEFLDASRSKQVVAAGIREAFHDLFAVNVKANELTTEQVKNKLKTLFAGKKTDVVLDRIAKTFRALCDYADFSQPTAEEASNADAQPTPATGGEAPGGENPEPLAAPEKPKPQPPHGKIAVSGLQYHINIVLPESRDQTVYDAIFRSLREHLG